MGNFDSFLGEVLAEVQNEKARRQAPARPPRIRWWEMPSRMDKVATPFVIVLDRVAGDVVDDMMDRLAHQLPVTGAEGTLIFPFEVEIGESK